MRKVFFKCFLCAIIQLFFVGVVSATQYSNYNEDNLLSCGGGYLTDIPAIIPKITSIIYVIIQVAVPILLVIFSSFDLIKAISAGKDDEIKKNQNVVIKRLIAGVLVFFVFAIVKFVVTNFTDSNIMDCASCFLDYKNSCS